MADETFLFTISDKDKMHSFTFPIIDFAIEKNNKELNLIFQQNFTQVEEIIKELKGDLNIVVDYTDDPTPQHAGSIVSLGYPLVRIVLNKCKILSYSPFVFNGKLGVDSEDFNIKFNREQRESLIVMPEEKIVDGKINITDDSVIRSYYQIPPGWEKPLYIVSCVINKKGHQTAVERLNMTTFHHKGDLIYLQNHVKKKTALENYDRLVKERIKCIA